MSIITTVALLVFLTIPEASMHSVSVCDLHLTTTSGISLVDQRGTLRCRCITMEKRPIGRYIGPVEINPVSSHCNNIEIIATLKKGGEKICLDPDAPWVKKVLKKKSAERTP